MALTQCQPMKMRIYVMALVLLLTGVASAVPSPGSSPDMDVDGVTVMWRGPAPDLNTSVLIIYLKPTAGMDYGTRVQTFWKKWRPQAEQGPWGFAIIKVTSSSRDDILANRGGVVGNTVFARDSDGHLLAQVDADTLSRIIIWEGKWHGMQLQIIPAWEWIGGLVLILVALVAFGRWRHNRRSYTSKLSQYIVPITEPADPAV